MIIHHLTLLQSETNSKQYYTGVKYKHDKFKYRICVAELYMHGLSLKRQKDEIFRHQIGLLVSLRLKLTLNN